MLFFLLSSVSVRSAIPAKASRHMNTPKDHPGIHPAFPIIRNDPAFLNPGRRSFKNASAFLPRRAWCEAPSFLRGCDPPEAFYLSGGLKPATETSRILIYPPLIEAGVFPTEINTCGKFEIRNACIRKSSRNGRNRRSHPLLAAAVPPLFLFSKDLFL